MLKRFDNRPCNQDWNVMMRCCGRFLCLVWLAGVAGPGLLAAAELPPVPGLNEDSQLRSGLVNCRLKFERDKSAVVAYVGGSITFAPGWSQQVDAELRRRFPHTTFKFVHAGIPSIDSTGHAFRLQQDVLAKGVPDLVFVEAAVNDLHNERSDQERRRAMEGIVRRLRQTNRFMDIVFLHFAEPRHTADYAAGRVPEVIASHETVAAQYGVPSVNLAREVQRRMAAGQFDWQKDFKDLHPSPFGHELYFRSLARLFDQAWNIPLPEQAAAREHSLPEPLDPFCYDAGSLIPPSRTEDVQGFTLDEHWQPAGKAGTRDGFVRVPMFVGKNPGDQFSLRFEGRAVGLFLAAGPNTGVVEYRVDGGEWKERDTFTRWSRGLYLPWALMLETDLPSGPHRLELRISNRKNEDGAGTALHIRDILVNG